MTYRELLDGLKLRTEAELDMPVQVFQYDPPQQGVVELRPVYALGAVADLMGEDEVVRCNRDGGNNRDSLVLCADLCFYDEHGEFAYTENWDGTCTGVTTGVVRPSPFPAEVGGE